MENTNDNEPMSEEDILWYKSHDEELKAAQEYIDTQCGGSSICAVAHLLRLKAQQEALESLIDTTLRIRYREELWKKFQEALDKFRGPLTLFAAKQFIEYTDKMRGVFETLPLLPRWRHKKRQSIYRELLRGELQVATTPPEEGDVVVAYIGEDGKVWMRKELEFTDGRFECLKKN